MEYSQQEVENIWQLNKIAKEGTEDEQSNACFRRIL